MKKSAALEDIEILSPANIQDIVLKVRDGEADPEDVRRLLETICHLIATNKPIPLEALQYIKDSFLDHLNDQKSLDRAFGIKRKESGRPKADEDQRQAMACEFLRLRVSGKSATFTENAVCSEFHRGRTVIREAWAEHKQFALHALRVQRIFENRAWTDKERSRLKKIFKNDAWYSCPVNQSK